MKKEKKQGEGINSPSLNVEGNESQQISGLDAFMADYAVHLELAVINHPDEYAWPLKQVPAVLLRMRQAIKNQSYNKDSRAFRDTCKTLGLAHTYKAINAFVSKALASPTDSGVNSEPCDYIFPSGDTCILDAAHVEREGEQSHMVDSIPVKHSSGHIVATSDGTTEFYARDGEVYRAPMASPVMTDGYRCGRWECSLSHFGHYRNVIVW